MDATTNNKLSQESEESTYVPSVKSDEDLANSVDFSADDWGCKDKTTFRICWKDTGDHVIVCVYNNDALCRVFDLFREYAIKRGFISASSKLVFMFRGGIVHGDDTIEMIGLEKRTTVTAWFHSSI